MITVDNNPIKLQIWDTVRSTAHRSSLQPVTSSFAFSGCAYVDRCAVALVPTPVCR
jgi:hypothetical protein